jgi:hypothetical protein
MYLCTPCALGRPAHVHVYTSEKKLRPIARGLHGPWQVDADNKDSVVPRRKLRHARGHQKGVKCFQWVRSHKLIVSGGKSDACIHGPCCANHSCLLMDLCASMYVCVHVYMNAILALRHAL